MYTSTLVLAIIIATAGGGAKPDVPYVVYGINCVSNGKDITYSLDKHIGEEALCKVDYRSAPHQNSDVKVETLQAEAFAGNLGNDWEVISKDLRYTKHWSVTKEEKLATFDKDGVKTLYDGLDKDEVTKFTEWDIIPIPGDL